MIEAPTIYEQTLAAIDDRIAAEAKRRADSVQSAVSRQLVSARLLQEMLPSLKEQAAVLAEPLWRASASTGVEPQLTGFCWPIGFRAYPDSRELTWVVIDDIGQILSCRRNTSETGFEALPVQGRGSDGLDALVNELTEWSQASDPTGALNGFHNSVSVILQDPQAIEQRLQAYLDSSAS